MTQRSLFAEPRPVRRELADIGRAEQERVSRMAAAARARRTDPSTSHEAARNSLRFSKKHKDVILEALRRMERPATAGEIAAYIGKHLADSWTGKLSSEAVTRRRSELVKDGRIDPNAGKRIDAVSNTSMMIWKLR